MSDAAHTRHRFQLGARLHAAPDNGHRRRLRSREQVGGEARGRAGTEGGQTGAIHHGQRHAGSAIAQENSGLDQRETALCVVVEKRDEFHGKELLRGGMTRHDQRHAVFSGRIESCTGGQRHLAAGQLRKRLAHGFDGFAHRQRAANVVRREMENSCIHIHQQVEQRKPPPGFRTCAAGVMESPPSAVQRNSRGIWPPTRWADSMT